MPLKPPVLLLCALPLLASEKPTKLFLLAGDELILEQGVIDGRTGGVFEAFFPNAEKPGGEEMKHSTASVYAGAYSPDADYEKMKPLATATVELGEQRTRQIQAGKRGREPVPFTPFPDAAMKDGHTTVVRGWVEVPYEGRYEFLPGKGESAFNITTVNGTETYRRAPGEAEPTITPVKLTPGTRHAFRTVFFGKPGHAFRIPLLDKPGALSTVLLDKQQYASLNATRDDVVLFDAHPIHNNTETAGHFLKTCDPAYGGRKPRGMIGIEQTLGRTLGDHFEEQAHRRLARPGKLPDERPGIHGAGQRCEKNACRHGSPLPRLQGLAPVELGGLVWFQGIADAASPRMAAEYEKHLNNLIRDLRKDLGKPELPVVIAAIGWDGTHAAKVRGAQLAAAEPSKKITAIDTRPFLRPAAVSPASSETTYHANAKPYLEIGQAIGEGILGLIKDDPAKR